MELSSLSALARKSVGKLTCASGAPGPGNRGAGLFPKACKRSPLLDLTIVSRTAKGLISLAISIILIISII